MESTLDGRRLVFRIAGGEIVDDGGSTFLRGAFIRFIREEGGGRKRFAGERGACVESGRG